MTWILSIESKPPATVDCFYFTKKLSSGPHSQDGTATSSWREGGKAVEWSILWPFDSSQGGHPDNHEIRGVWSPGFWTQLSRQLELCESGPKVSHCRRSRFLRQRLAIFIPIDLELLLGWKTLWILEHWPSFFHCTGVFPLRRLLILYRCRHFFLSRDLAALNLQWSGRWKVFKWWPWLSLGWEVGSCVAIWCDPCCLGLPGLQAFKDSAVQVSDASMTMVLRNFLPPKRGGGFRRVWQLAFFVIVHVLGIVWYCLVFTL